MCKVTLLSATYSSSLSEQNLFLDACTETMPKAMDVHVRFQKTGFGFLQGNFFLLFGFQQRLFSKGTENHPSAKQQITSVSLNHTRALWKLERVLFGKAGRDGSEPWEEGFISFSHVSHC